MINCYRLDQDWEQLRDDLRDHWTRDDVYWALMDYDQSIMHPANVSLKTYRRPTNEAWAGADTYRPDDVYLGEPTYNPFAFDVAMLGNLFRVRFAVRCTTTYLSFMLTYCVARSLGYACVSSAVRQNDDVRLCRALHRRRGTGIPPTRNMPLNCRRSYCSCRAGAQMGCISTHRRLLV